MSAASWCVGSYQDVGEDGDDHGVLARVFSVEHAAANRAADHGVMMTSFYADHVACEHLCLRTQVSPMLDCRWLFGRNRRGTSASQPSSPAAAGASPAELGTPRHDLASIEEMPGTAVVPVDDLPEPTSPDSNVSAPVGKPARAPAASTEGLWTAGPPRDLQDSSVVLVPGMGLDWADDITAELVSSWKAAAGAGVHDGPEGHVSSDDGAGRRQVLDRQQQAVRTTPPLLRWAAVPSVPSPMAALQQAALPGAQQLTTAQSTAADAHPDTAPFDSMAADTHGARMRGDRVAEPPDDRDGQPAPPVNRVAAPEAANSLRTDHTQEIIEGGDHQRSAPEPPAPLPSGSPTTDRTCTGECEAQDSLQSLSVDGPQRRPKSAPAGTVTVATQSSQQPVAESSAQTSTTRLSALQRLKQRASRRQAAALSSSVELAQHGGAGQPPQPASVEEDGPTALESAAAATRFGAWLQVRLTDEQHTAVVQIDQSCRLVLYSCSSAPDLSLRRDERRNCPLYVLSSRLMIAGQERKAQACCTVQH